MWENIRYGRLEASDEEIIEAAKSVSADKVVGKMEKGYDSDVGESGGLLSTGEKQLISFARAVLANPAIFVLEMCIRDRRWMIWRCGGLSMSRSVGSARLRWGVSRITRMNMN